MSTEPHFEGQTDGPTEVGPRSVIASLHESLRIRERILLRDTSGSGDDVGDGGAPSPEAAAPQARYQVLGELARGGMGLVLKARDADLGRDVAMKVLRKEFIDRKDVVERFIEEAQIGGQLQHPGIVPVYEMGLRKDEVPYFTMKLVKGRTLAAMLSERDDPRGGRRRFVSIFESVCQTLSYAHSRGVVHRDIKPSNIMVGAFGQVLVVDWGLAKVKAQGGVDDERAARRKLKKTDTIIATVRSGSSGSHSLVGSVIGTPQYMPPEQARGEVDSLDERSDVFSLGAILCEILTGEPPYTGDDAEIVRQAASANLDGARERLGRSGADPALLELVLACLAPAPQARPRDAGEVADAVRRHLASAEERERAAQTAASEARVRAIEAQRSRKLTTALSISAVAALVVGGGAYLWISATQQARAAEAHALVAGAMGEATRHRGRATSAGSLEDWAAAELAAERAVALAGPDSDAETRADAERLLDEVREGREAAEAAARASEQARRTAERLEALRLEVWDLDQQAVEARYAAAFSDGGIDVRTLSPTEAAERVAASPIAVRLAAALDSWAATRVRAGLSPDPMRAIARTADPDPWRVALRDAEGVDDLRELARTADPAALPLESLATLAAGLAAARDFESALDLGLRTLDHHPGDLWTRSQVAIWLVSLGRDRVQEAIRHSLSAVALGPESSSVWANHAWVLLSAKDPAGAEAACLEAIRLNERNGLAITMLGRVHLERAENEEAVRAFERAIELEPDLAEARIGLGDARRGGMDWSGAADAYREAVELEPRSARARVRLAQHLWLTGFRAAALAEFEEAVRLEPDDFDHRVEVANRLSDVRAYRRAVAHLEEAIRIRPTARGVHLNIGYWSRNIGDYARAELAFRAVIRLDPRARQTYGSLGLALMYRGDMEAALAEWRVCWLRSGSAPDVWSVENYGAALRTKARTLHGKDAEALLDEAERVLRTFTNISGYSRQELGRIEWRRGDYRGAYSQWSAAERVGKTSYRADMKDLAKRMRDLARAAPGAERGEHVPKDLAETALCARLAEVRGNYAAAAGYLEAALSQDTSLARTSAYGAWYMASAASAGWGEDGPDLSDEERAHWRDLAVSWAQDAVRSEQKRLDDDPAAAGSVVSFARRMLSDYDTVPLRRPEYTARLAPRKRAELRKLWDDVRALLIRAEDVYVERALRPRPFLGAWFRSTVTHPWPDGADLPALGEDDLARIVADATSRVPVAPTADYVDFAGWLGEREFTSGYVVQTFVADEDRTVRCLLGSDDAVRVWVDGREVFRNVTRRMSVPDEDAFELALAAGRHTLVVEVSNAASNWRLHFRVTDDAGTALVLDPGGRLVPVE